MYFATNRAIAPDVAGASSDGLPITALPAAIANAIGSSCNCTG